MSVCANEGHPSEKVAADEGKHLTGSVPISSVSSCASLPWGVAQGSIFGPVLFSLYFLPSHLCVDVTPIFLRVKRGDGSSAGQLLDCLGDVKAQMARRTV